MPENQKNKKMFEMLSRSFSSCYRDKNKGKKDKSELFMSGFSLELLAYNLQDICLHLDVPWTLHICLHSYACMSPLWFRA
jgi:hypothetical protein